MEPFDAAEPNGAEPTAAVARCWRWALIGLIAGACAVGIPWAAIAMTTVSATGAATFTLHGTMELRGGYDDVISTGSGCAGTGGYSDIADGTAVTVYNATGAVIASGDLENSTGEAGTCDYDIVVPGVPTGSKFYQVEVSHRGKITVSSHEAEHGQVSITLGD